MKTDLDRFKEDHGNKFMDRERFIEEYGSKALAAADLMHINQGANYLSLLTGIKDVHVVIRNHHLRGELQIWHKDTLISGNWFDTKEGLTDNKVKEIVQEILEQHFKSSL